MPHDFLDELNTHALFHQVTDKDGLRTHLNTGSRRGYAGFDPTADSFTIGNMVPMILLRHLQLAGHTPVILCGGGTGLIGDPSGKSAERTLMTEETVRANVESQRKIFSKVIDFGDKKNPPVMVNNVDWLGKLGFLEVLRDVGKHFSVNMMIQKDSVKSRLESRDQGISYTEFSYMILQAYDFAHLHKTMGVTLQMGGSDQWGNIVAGIDLTRLKERDRMREEQSKYNELFDILGSSGQPDFVENARLARTMAQSSVDLWFDPASALVQTLVDAQQSSPRARELASALQGKIEEIRGLKVYGITNPLVTKADGGKFGKSEKGAVWMTADRTSPYAMYQFWLNTADADIPRFVRTFTFLPAGELDAILAGHAADPGKREAHRVLARAVTEMLHGKTEMEAAEAAGKALFSGEIASLPEATLREVFAEVPSSEHAKASLEGDGIALIDLLVTTKLAASKRESKDFLTQGSVLVNGRKVGPDDKVRTSDLLFGHTIAIRRGKKNWHITRWA